MRFGGGIPDLIYGIITGYGLEGPDAHRPGYDIGAFWARSSLASSVVPPGTLPPPIRSGLGDHVTGMTLAGGICGALFDRQRTGRGHLVSTSLLRTGLYSAAWDLGVLLRFGRLESTRYREQSKTPLVNCYAAADGSRVLAARAGGRPALARCHAAIDRPDLAADERFASARSRVLHAAELIAEFDVTFAARPMDEWADALRRPRCVVGADQHGALRARTTRRSRHPERSST